MELLYLTFYRKDLVLLEAGLFRVYIHPEQIYCPRQHRSIQVEVLEDFVDDLQGFSIEKKLRLLSDKLWLLCFQYAHARFYRSRK